MQEKRIGLHNHRIEATNSLAEFLEECLNEGVSIVSITDHKTLNTYIEEFPKLTTEQIKKYEHIQFIIGMELTVVFPYINIAGQKGNVAIDLLAYNMDLQKSSELKAFIQKSYISTDKQEYQQAELERVITIAKKIGFQADYDNMKITEENPLAGRIMGTGLTQPEYIEHNLKIGLSREIQARPRSFYNRYCKNPISPFYVDMSQYLPSVQQGIDIIHQCGGEVTFAHTAGYNAKTGSEELKKQAWDDSKKFTTDFLSQYGEQIQGLEVIHPCYLGNKEFEDFLRKIAKEYQLYITGGTDYHQPGQPIAKDIKGKSITSDRLAGIEKWAKFYSIDEIIKIAKSIKKIREEVER